MNLPELPLRSKPQTGSPPNGEPEFLVIGKLRRPHGLRGELVMEVLTGFPERITRGVTVFVGKGYRPMQLRNCRWHQQTLLVQFQDYDDRDRAGELRNQFVYVRSGDLPSLDDGEYYQHELIGLEVYTSDELRLGKVVEILETGANDVLVIRREGGTDLLLPYIDQVITMVDLAEKRLEVRMLPGILADE